MAAPLHLIPPNHSPHGPEQSPLSSPTHNASSTNLNASVGNISSDVLLERSEIDKSLKALETIVGVLYDYAKLWQNLVGLDKKLVKSLKDAGTFKGQVEWPSGCISSGALECFVDHSGCRCHVPELITNIRGHSGMRYQVFQACGARIRNE